MLLYFIMWNDNEQKKTRLYMKNGGFLASVLVNWCIGKICHYFSLHVGKWLLRFLTILWRLITLNQVLDMFAFTRWSCWKERNMEREICTARALFGLYVFGMGLKRRHLLPHRSKVLWCNVTQLVERNAAKTSERISDHSWIPGKVGVILLYNLTSVTCLWFPGVLRLAKCLAAAPEDDITRAGRQMMEL